MMIQARLGWLEVELGQISTLGGGFRFVGALGGRKKCGFLLPNILKSNALKLSQPNPNLNHNPNPNTTKSWVRYGNH